jgi:hypothetical protein
MICRWASTEVPSNGGPVLWGAWKAVQDKGGVVHVQHLGSAQMRDVRGQASVMHEWRMRCVTLPIREMDCMGHVRVRMTTCKHLLMRVQRLVSMIQ